MAGRELKIRGKVKASTILEVLISMIIIIVVFGIGMMIFSNVTRLSLSSKKLNVEAILQDRLLDLEQSNNNADETTVAGDFHIEQKIAPYNGNSHLSQVHLIAFDANNVVVAELEKVIMEP